MKILSKTDKIKVKYLLQNINGVGLDKLCKLHHQKFISHYADNKSIYMNGKGIIK